MVSRSTALAGLTIAVASMLLSACAGAPFGGSPSEQGFGERLPGTWIEGSGDGTAALVLSDDGTFEARDFPAALVCGRSTGGPEPEACLASPGASSVSAEGTWSVLDEEQGMLELDADGRLFSIAYRDLDDFSGSSFSLGFSTGTLEKPEPDYVFARSS